MSDRHHHDDHEHGADPIARRNALRAEALESLLVERGLVQPDVVDAIVTRFEQDIGPLNGAKLVARAWTDPAFKIRLLADPWAAIEELGLPTGPDKTPIVVLEDAPDLHHVVVCTLCSCYPSSLLGLPPTWYKSPPYRSRVVREPRAVLREMGLDLPPEVAVRVSDSSAEVRYLVLPMRPAGTVGWSEEDLRRLVTRDTLIGVARPSVAVDDPAPGKPT
ncbi:MAG: nitrile hydratase subunit alpha [Deltaproteobacteria bacterium]|nr:nitrile hydratase subunit alpha [Deltaproteobacteria bacterium]